MTHPWRIPMGPVEVFIYHYLPIQVLWDQFVGKYTGLVPMDVLWVYGFMGYGCYGNLKKLIWSLILLRFHQLWADSEDHLRNDPENSKWDEFGCNFFEHPRSHHFWLKCYHPNRPLLKKTFMFNKGLRTKKAGNIDISPDSPMPMGREVADAEQWSQLLRKLATCPPSDVVRSAYRLAPWVSSRFF